jgi:hypothetical protein
LPRNPYPQPARRRWLRLGTLITAGLEPQASSRSRMSWADWAGPCECSPARRHAFCL